MHKITDQIKLLMVQNNHQIGEMRGKIGENLNKEKKQMREKLFLGKIKSPTLSHLLTVT